MANRIYYDTGKSPNDRPAEMETRRPLPPTHR